MRFSNFLFLGGALMLATAFACLGDVSVYGGATGVGGTSSGAVPPAMTSTSANGSGLTGGATGNPECGNGVCEEGETTQNCPADCGSTSSCDHSICEVGEALTVGCEACVDTVCAADDYCCETYWDDECIAAADELCQAGCCGNGMCEGQTCDACEADCGACVCGDNKCEGESCTSCEADCGPCAACPHAVCDTGAPLSVSACRDACVDSVCAQQASCCGDGGESGWDASCIVLAAALCGGDPCVSAVCAQNAACCGSSWDASCVETAKTACGTECDCSHSICDSGWALSATCEPCVASICAADPYCCNSDWDGICVEEVASICGIDCS